MNGSHCQREALADAQRQPFGLIIHDIAQSEQIGHFFYSGRDIGRRQIKEVCMHIQVLLNGQLAIERKGLGHVPDSLLEFNASGFQRAAEDKGLAMSRVKEPGEHLHGRGLPAAVRTYKTEYLSLGYGERDIVHRGEVAEPFGEMAGLDCRAVTRGYPGRGREAPMPITHLLWQHGYVRILYGRFPGLLLNVFRCTRCEDPATLHHDQPVEVLGLLHVCRGDKDTHARMVAAHILDKLPELAPRQRIDAGRRLVHDEHIRVVDQGTAQPKFLFHPS